MVLQRNENFKWHKTSAVQVATRHGTTYLKVLNKQFFKSRGRIKIFKIERLRASTSQGNHFRKFLQDMFQLHEGKKEKSWDQRVRVSENLGKGKEDYLDHLPGRQRRLLYESSVERENSVRNHNT